MTTKAPMPWWATIGSGGAYHSLSGEETPSTPKTPSWARARRLKNQMEKAISVLTR